MRSLRLLTLTLLTLVPPGAFADGNVPIEPPHVREEPKQRVSERGPCVGSGEVARVADVSGDVRAYGAGGAERVLACDDALNACETVVTGAGSGASLLMNEALVQLGPDTRAELSLRPGPDVALERGAARVVDPRTQAADRVQLYTPSLTASTGHGDAELTRSDERVRACAYAEPLVITARDGAQTIPAGSCLETGTRVLGGTASGPAGAPSVALGDGASCPFHVAGMPSLLPPVGTEPPGGPNVLPFDPPGRDSCDDPGSGCAAAPVCEICEDPDPGTGCGFPGSPCGDE